MRKIKETYIGIGMFPILLVFSCFGALTISVCAHLRRRMNTTYALYPNTDVRFVRALWPGSVMGTGLIVLEKWEFNAQPDNCYTSGLKRSKFPIFS